MQKYTKIQASVQHGLYLFTCEIHSFNSIWSSFRIHLWNILGALGVSWGHLDPARRSQNCFSWLRLFVSWYTSGTVPCERLILRSSTPENRRDLSTNMSVGHREGRTVADVVDVSVHVAPSWHDFSLARWGCRPVSFSILLRMASKWVHMQTVWLPRLMAPVRLIYLGFLENFGPPIFIYFYTCLHIFHIYFGV